MLSRFAKTLLTSMGIPCDIKATTRTMDRRNRRHTCACSRARPIFMTESDLAFAVHYGIIARSHWCGHGPDADASTLATTT